MKMRGGVIPALAFMLLAAGVCPAAGDAVLSRGTRITLQLNHTLGTGHNSEGDPFTAVVTTPVYQAGRIVIPKGSVVSGSVSRILRPGRLKGKAILNLLFQSISIPGRGQLDIVATLARIDDEGSSGTGSEGSIKSAGSGAAGSGAPAVGERGAVFSSRGQDLEVHRGSTLDILLDRPLTIPAEKVK